VWQVGKVVPFLLLSSRETAKKYFANLFELGKEGGPKSSTANQLRRGSAWPEELAKRLAFYEKLPRKTQQTLLANPLSKWP
jgi:hypothetical protein